MAKTFETLDEAIQRIEELAGRRYKHHGSIPPEPCSDCHEEWQMISEWLKDYKRLKSLHHEYTDRTQKHSFFYYEDSASAEIQVRTFPMDRWVFTKTRAPRMSKEEFIRWCKDWEDSRA